MLAALSIRLRLRGPSPNGAHRSGARTPHLLSGQPGLLVGGKLASQPASRPAGQRSASGQLISNLLWATLGRPDCRGGPIKGRSLRRRAAAERRQWPESSSLSRKGSSGARPRGEKEEEAEGAAEEAAEQEPKWGHFLAGMCSRDCIE